MARVVTKIGDIFSVKMDENTKKYFQLIAFDLTQLNSDVIRAFKQAYPIDSKPDVSEIVNGMDTLNSTLLNYLCRKLIAFSM